MRDEDIDFIKDKIQGVLGEIRKETSVTLENDSYWIEIIWLEDKMLRLLEMITVGDFKEFKYMAGVQCSSITKHTESIKSDEIRSNIRMNMASIYLKLLA